MDNELEKYPELVFLCGGDVNCLDVHEFQALSGWKLSWLISRPGATRAWTIALPTVLISLVALIPFIC